MKRFNFTLLYLYLFIVLIFSLYTFDQWNNNILVFIAPPVLLLVCGYGLNKYEAIELSQEIWFLFIAGVLIMKTGSSYLLLTKHHYENAYTADLFAYVSFTESLISALLLFLMGCHFIYRHLMSLRMR